MALLLVIGRSIDPKLSKLIQLDKMQTAGPPKDHKMSELRAIAHVPSTCSRIAVIPTLILTTARQQSTNQPV